MCDTASRPAASPSLSACSTPGSFYTAHGSDEQESTTASSPAYEALCSYREARPLPRELKEHCCIFLEEQLYSCAIHLLNSTLGAGMSRQRPRVSKAVPVPPPSHLALLNTLIVHPSHTTRAQRPELREIPSLALNYLRSLLVIVGPIHANFRTAFQFRAGSRSSRRPRSSRYDPESDLSDGSSDRESDVLHGNVAGASSVWNRGQDFWSTVGWAFNTATLHPHRWRCWSIWLEFMLDVLEADWAEREKRDMEGYESDFDEDLIPTVSRGEAMVALYLDYQEQQRSVNFRQIIKALLADGTDLSATAFPEVFEREPRGPRKESRKRKRELQVLDLEQDRFGDYLDEESMSSGVSEPPTPQKPLAARHAQSTDSGDPGLAATIDLRLRLFRLLSAATHALRTRRELNQLYGDFAASVKVLPLPMFSLFVSQRDNPLLPEIHVTIKQLSHLLLPSNYKDPAKVDREGHATGAITMPILDHCFVASHANTVALEDNAKLSLIVESAIQLLWNLDMVWYSESFDAAVEKGIAAREAKVKKRTGKVRADAADTQARDILMGSAERLRVLLKALKMTDGEERA